MPKRVKPYDPKPFQRLLQKLLDESKESLRAVSSAVGLSPTSLSKYMRGTCPSRDVCIVLADHFGISPNEMLKAAGYEQLAIFDQTLIDPEQLSPDVKAFAQELQKIPDMEKRRRVIEAVTELIDPYLPNPATNQKDNITSS